MTGRLYLVSLPIGNLEDITLRAIKTLRAVDLIVAEDTRNTSRVLERYHIKTPFSRSYYQGVERKRVEPILSLLKEGKGLALVSDAGTPLVSDPGYPLVRATIEAGIPVVPIPGPTAAITALVASGLPTDHFAFDGTVPRKQGELRAYLEAIREEQRTIVLYESPHRLLTTLKEIAKVLPERRVVLARELTKLHEEFLRGSASEILQTLDARGEIKGECVLLIEGEKGLARKTEPHNVKEAVLLLKKEGIPNRTAMKILMCCLDLPRNEAYRLIHTD
jgi:16S rRNA (cytidine1402-2'-O)-methyltransferase